MSLLQRRSPAHGLRTPSWVTSNLGRAEALGALAPQLPKAEQAAVYIEALEAVRKVTNDEVRAVVLFKLAPHLPVELLGVALEATHSIANDEVHAVVLFKLAPHLALHPLHLTQWQSTIRVLAATGRPHLLSGLTALMPWFAALTTPQDLQATAHAIRDVARCRP